MVRSMAGGGGVWLPQRVLFMRQEKSILEGPKLSCSPVSQCPCHPKEEGREQHNAPPTSPQGD